MAKFKLTVEMTYPDDEKSALVDVLESNAVTEKAEECLEDLLTEYLLGLMLSNCQYDDVPVIVNNFFIERDE